MSNIIGGSGSSSKGKGRATSRTSRATTTTYPGATWNPTGAGSSSDSSTIPISPIPVPAPTGQPIYASQYPNPSPYVPQPYPGTSGFIQPGPFPGPASPPYLQQPPYPTQYGPSSYQYPPSATGRATPTSSFNPSSSGGLATPTSSSNPRRSPQPESLLSQDEWAAFLETGMMSYSPPRSRTRTSRTSKTPEPSSSGTRAQSTYLPQDPVPGGTIPRSQSRAAFSSSPTPYQAAQRSTAYMGQQSLYQNPGYAPAGGSTSSASAGGSTSYAPAGSSTSYASAGGSTSSAPARSSTSYSPVGGSTSYQALANIPQQGPVNLPPQQPNQIPANVQRRNLQPGQGVFRATVSSSSAASSSSQPPQPPLQGRFSVNSPPSAACSCDISFARESERHRHWQTCCPDNPSLKTYACDVCGAQYSRKDNMRRHRRKH